jgi:hypothetical protein
MYTTYVSQVELAHRQQRKRYRFKSGRNDIGALLGLREVPKDVVNADDCVLAGPTSDIDLLEVANRFESTFVVVT